VALIDVRSAEEFRGPLGHIACASNIPIAELSAKIRELNEIKRKPVITI
jgi:3-mercaptopyruvate sulfurtransferase SseA